VADGGVPGDTLEDHRRLNARVPGPTTAGGTFATPPLRRGDYYVVAVSRAVFNEDWRNPR
jgi:hypothetical protein